MGDLGRAPDGGPSPPIASTSARPSNDTMTASDHSTASANVLKRAELAKMRRLLDQRLGFATFKALRGWARYNLDVIEPEVEREVAERKRQAYEAAAMDAARQRAAMPLAPAHALHTRAESMHHPYPPGGSLFDAMLTPSMHSILSPHSETLHAPRDPAFGPPSAKRARLDGPGRPPLQAMPSALSKHRRAPSAASSHVTWSADLPTHSPHSAQIVRPLSTSDPHFARSATEFVDAATALTSFTRGGSQAPTEAEAPIQDREADAELMLFLAHSPSPPRTRRAPSATSDFGSADVSNGAGGMMPRRLFGEEDGGNGSASGMESPATTIEPSSQASNVPKSAPAKIAYRTQMSTSPLPPPPAQPFYPAVSSMASTTGAAMAYSSATGKRGSVSSASGLGTAFDFSAYSPRNGATSGAGGGPGGGSSVVTASPHQQPATAWT